MLTTVAAGRVFDFSHCIGMYGMSGQGFWSPQDFVFGPDGLIFVISRGSEELGQRITKCTLDHEFVTQFGGFGPGDGQFIWPRSIDMDAGGNLYTSDEQLHRISIFDQEGNFLDKWGTPGSGDGEVNGPSGIAFDKDDNLFLVDSLNHRVQRFTKEGKFLGKWGRHGSGDGELDMPWGICLDGNGDVYVADWNNNRVQVYDSDGTFIATLVGDAVEPSPCAQTYIAANPDMVKARRRANMEPEWRFRRPVAVNVDEQDRIFVLESARHRLQVYNKEKDYEEHPINL